MTKIEIRQLSEMFCMVERGELSEHSFLLAFKSRFATEINNARNRWREKNPLWKNMDWSRVENDPLLSQLISVSR